VHLTAIDANPKLRGDQAFSWIGSAQFGGKAGELRYFSETTADGSSNTVVQGDINGDKVRSS
jgi:hypothetical protein